jgi:hypothetical protein
MKIQALIRKFLRKINSKRAKAAILIQSHFRGMKPRWMLKVYYKQKLEK